MNIFVTDKSPHISAANLDDKRVIKMILESAQMLSTAMYEHNAPNPPYKVTHKNHPCTVWARTTRANYLWLFDHFLALMSQYSFRYGRAHACERLVDTLLAGAAYVPIGDLTPFANCSRYKELDVIAAYQKTMNEKWKEDQGKRRKAKWTYLSPPSWLDQM